MDLVKSANESNNFFYYVKNPEEYNYRNNIIPVRYLFKNDKTIQNPHSMYRDFREFSKLDDVVSILLDYRGNWVRVDNPFEYNYINFSWVGSDTTMIPKKFTTIEFPDPTSESGFRKIKDKLANILENGELIDIYEEKMRIIRDVKIDKKTVDFFSKSAILNRQILNISQVGTRLSKLTRITGDKSSLYSLIRSYADRTSGVSNTETIIPESYELDMTLLEQELKDNTIEFNETNVKERLDIYFNEIFKDSKTVWVVKPVYGSHGLGMQIDTSEEIRKRFYEWSQEEYFFNNENIKFSSWMFSKFIESFKWKLTNNSPDSLILTKKWNKIKIGKMMGDHDKGEEDTSIRVENPISGKQIPTFKSTNPSYKKSSINSSGETKRSKDYKPFREHKFNDTSGRINKARIWMAVDTSNKEIKLYVCNRILFELCSLEFDDYKSLQQTWTDSSAFIYGKKSDIDEELIGKNIKTEYNLDPVNASIACDLDLCFMVDFETGKWKQNVEARNENDFPLNWNKIKENIKKMFKIFFNTIKHNVNCLSEVNENVKSLGCFQYFGVDFIVDKDCNVWLLEFNTRPWSGYGFWWTRYFDSNNIHMPNKYHFTESLLRKFIDIKFKPNKIPDLKSINFPEWIELSNEFYSKISKPYAITNNIIPFKGQSNWILNRQINEVFNNRDIHNFPFPDLAKDPELLLQGVTPYMRHLVKNYNSENFRTKMLQMYPFLKNVKNYNRIFSFMVYLGDKARLVDCLQSYIKNWDEIIPYTVYFDKRASDFNNNVKIVLEKYNKVNNKEFTWIAKPNLGKQGTGIVIEKNIDLLLKGIKKENIFNEENDKWVISRYLNNPFLLHDRKTHIRTFVLIVKNKENIDIYMSKYHFIFMAGLPYDENKAADFINRYFKNSYDKSRINQFRNLTNLSKGSDMIKNFIDSTKINNATNDFEKNLNEKMKKNPMSKNIGYEILSRKLGNKYVANFENINDQIKNIVIYTIESIQDEIKCLNDNDSCFQYLAFDLMIDVENNIEKVWLLEVNTNPGLKAPTALLEGGLSRFLNNVFDCVMGEFPNIENGKYKPKKFNIKKPLKKYPNVFELIKSKKKYNVKDKVENTNKEKMSNDLTEISPFGMGWPFGGKGFNLPFGNPSFMSNFMQGVLPPSSDNISLQEYVIRLKDWQSRKNHVMTFSNSPYYFLFPQFNEKELGSQARFIKNRMDFNQSPLFNYGGLTMPLTAGIFGFTHGSNYNSFGMMPKLGDDVLKLVKKLRPGKDTGDFSINFCESYHNDDIDSLMSSLGIPKQGLRSKIQKCAAIHLYHMSGFLSGEMPFARDPFLGNYSMYSNPENNKVYQDYQKQIEEYLKLMPKLYINDKGELTIKPNGTPVPIANSP